MTSDLSGAVSEVPRSKVNLARDLMEQYFRNRRSATKEEGGEKRCTFGAKGRCGDGAGCFQSGRFACAEEN